MVLVRKGWNLVRIEEGEVAAPAEALEDPTPEATPGAVEPEVKKPEEKKPEEKKPEEKKPEEAPAPKEPVEDKKEDSKPLPPLPD